MTGGTDAEGAAAETGAHTALRLAGDFALGTVWLVVVLGTVAAWIGLDVLGGLALGGFLDTSYGEGAAVVGTVVGLVAAMTFVMALVWRRGRGDSWFFLLWILMAFLFLAGVPMLIAVAFTDPIPGGDVVATGSATRILVSIGYAIPLAGSLFAMLVASARVFPHRSPVAAGLLAVAAEALAIGIWVVLAAAVR